MRAIPIQVLVLLLAACQMPASDAIAEATRGTALAQQGKYDLAVQHYKAAIQMNPHLPGIYLNLGLAYFKSKRFPEAASAFEEAVRADSGNFQARTLLGMSYYGVAKYALAAKHLKPASEMQPDNLELRHTLAQSYLWSEQYQEAIAEFKFLLARNPDSAHVHVLLGQVLDAAGQVESATAEFEAAAKASPRQPDVHFELGYLYWKQHGDRNLLRSCRIAGGEIRRVHQIIEKSWRGPPGCANAATAYFDPDAVEDAFR